MVEIGMTNFPAWIKPRKRPILNDVLSSNPDKPLYHYTDQTGLLGITKDREIRATHTQYLNDRREFLHAVDLVNEEITRLLNEGQDSSPHPPDQSAREGTLLKMRRALTLSPQTINVCVCSFSEKRDSLSQWRAYGGPSGFAIGFSGQMLKAVTERQNWFLVPCIYDLPTQRNLVRALVEEVLEENLGGPLVEGKEEDALFKAIGGNLPTYLNVYAPILKHESFQEESEWRIISRPIVTQRLDYREGRSLIVPYFKLPLCNVNQELELHEIVIGPTPDAQRSKSSIIRLMMTRKVAMQEGHAGVNVNLSEVPYRNW
jgi:hypothetical protein